jgi:hypothetical protein
LLLVFLVISYCEILILILFSISVLVLSLFFSLFQLPSCMQASEHLTWKHA